MRNFNKEQLKKDIENADKFSLSVREKAVIYYRFGLTDGLTHTLEETGKLYGVTRERIRQIEEKILEKLGGLDKYLIKE